MTSNRENKLRAAFCQFRQRDTRQRQHIAERLVELANSGEVFTVEDLWHELQQREPHLGRSTLYRSIEMLVSLNILDRIAFADGTHHYRVCGGEDHQHLTCVRCHRVIEVHLALPVEQFARVSEQHKFALEGLSLTLFGCCAVCRSL